MLSRDGSRLYQSAGASWDAPTIDHIDVFDTVNNVKQGTIALPTGIVSCAVDDYNCNRYGTFVLSPFDNTIFWAGNQGLAIIPIPSTMAAPLPMGLRIKPARPR